MTAPVIIGGAERKWRREMMRAVRDAAAETVLFRGSSLANGLRAIRTFERVNACAFDPFDEYHRQIVHGMGVHESLFRRMRSLTRSLFQDQAA